MRVDVQQDGAGDAIRSSVTIAKDVWVHLVLTRDDDNYVMYVNGNNVGSGSSTKQLPAVLRNNWFGRSNWPDTILNAAFDEIRVYNRALPADAVTALSVP